MTLSAGGIVLPHQVNDDDHIKGEKSERSVSRHGIFPLVPVIQRLRLLNEKRNFALTCSGAMLNRKACGVRSRD